MAPSAADLIGLAGIRPKIQSDRVGGAGLDAPWPAIWRSASATGAATGQTFRAKDAAIAPRPADASSSAAKVSTARAA